MSDLRKSLLKPLFGKVERVMTTQSSLKSNPRHDSSLLFFCMRAKLELNKYKVNETEDEAQQVRESLYKINYLLGLTIKDPELTLLKIIEILESEVFEYVTEIDLQAAPVELFDQQILLFKRLMIALSYTEKEWFQEILISRKSFKFQVANCTQNFLNSFTKCTLSNIQKTFLEQFLDRLLKLYECEPVFLSCWIDEHINNIDTNQKGELPIYDLIQNVFFTRPPDCGFATSAMSRFMQLSSKIPRLELWIFHNSNLAECLIQTLVEILQVPSLLLSNYEKYKKISDFYIKLIISGTSEGISELYVHIFEKLLMSILTSNNLDVTLNFHIWLCLYVKHFANTPVLEYFNLRLFNSGEYMNSVKKLYFSDERYIILDFILSVLIHSPLLTAALMCEERTFDICEFQINHQQLNDLRTMAMEVSRSDSSTTIRKVLSQTFLAAKNQKIKEENKNCLLYSSKKFYPSLLSHSLVNFFRNTSSYNQKLTKVISELLHCRDSGTIINAFFDKPSINGVIILDMCRITNFLYEAYTAYDALIVKLKIDKYGTMESGSFKGNQLYEYLQPKAEFLHLPRADDNPISGDWEILWKYQYDSTDIQLTHEWLSLNMENFRKYIIEIYCGCKLQQLIFKTEFESQTYLVKASCLQ